MLEFIVESYQDPRFWWFPVGGTLVSVVAFLSFAAPLTWLAIKDPAPLQKYRIQRRRGRRDLIWPSVRKWLSNNFIQLVFAVVSWPLLSLSNVHLGPLPAWWVVILQLLFFIYLDDFLYYWMHRALHHKRIYDKVHGVHHQIGAPWAIMGHYMHPLEYVMTTTVMLIGPVLIGAHIGVIYLWIIIRQLEAAEGHCGYDFPFALSKLIPLSHGPAHHDFHHARWNGNFAGFLPLHDRIFGTESRGYRRWIQTRRERRAAAGGEDAN